MISPTALVIAALFFLSVSKVLIVAGSIAWAAWMAGAWVVPRVATVPTSAVAMPVISLTAFTPASASSGSAASAADVAGSSLVAVASWDWYVAWVP